MTDTTALDDAPVVFLDGVLVDTVTPLRSNQRPGPDGLFRVDYFGRGIAVAYGNQLRVMVGAA